MLRSMLTAAVLALSGGTALADCNKPAPINVAPDAKESTVETDAPTTTLDCYQVSARAGQQLTVSISGTKSDAVFTVYAPGWTANCDSSDDCDIEGDELVTDEPREWSDIAPGTGAYLIVIDNSRSDSDYRLNVVLQENREPSK